MYNIQGIPQEAVDKLWRFAEPYVKRSLEHTFGELSCDNIRDFCLGGDMQLWMIVKERRVVGAGTTQLVIYPQMKTCRVITLAGSEFDEWMDQAHMAIEVWADNMGCAAMEAYVRKGFVKKLSEIGYKHRYSVVHKSLRG